MIDKLIIQADKALRTLTHKAVSRREHPDCNIQDIELNANDKKHVIGLMRIDHCGEICAQGLYQGQALTSRNKTNKEIFEDAAFEETEHLAWTKHRLDDLGGKTSYLNTFFYFASMTLGIGAGILGDKWSLGFLEETEKQVEQHLADHLEQIPQQDEKSKAILQQMKKDEANHAEMAHNYGAANLPYPVKIFMKISSKVMTKITYVI